MEIEFLEIEEKHLETIRKWRNADEVRRYMYTDQEIGIEQQKKWFAKILERNEEKHWIVECNDKLVGMVNLKRIDNLNHTAEWAFYLGELESRGTGIGILIEFKLLELVFEKMGLHKLNCSVLDFNAVVVDLHKKFGFTEEGRLRQQIFKNGRYRDVVLLGMLAEEWKKNRGKMVRIVDRLNRSKKEDHEG